jgi:hypothetical protein
VDDEREELDVEVLLFGEVIVEEEREGFLEGDELVPNLVVGVFLYSLEERDCLTAGGVYEREGCFTLWLVVFGFRETV